ncbi:MAG: hypothetical protein COA78_34025 [Blastopirellula sp.]|nr:MAG: hypothetical protein COA78_34025 [Blastopirellula sp.]
MNEKHPNELIDEAELRAALQPLRPDPDSFAAGIRQRVEEAEVKLRDQDFDEAKLENSDWLQVAASVIPLPLFGNAGSSGLVKLGQLTLGKKMVAVAALPAIGLLLMVTASIWAIIKIRRVQRGQLAGDIDVLKAGEVTAAWWRQNGYLLGGMSLLMLPLMFTGYTIPVFIIFLVSGIAMVSLITKLGKERLVDRKAIAKVLCPALIILCQLTHLSSMFIHGNPFLDQMLIPAILLLGGIVMLVVCDPASKNVYDTGLVGKWFGGILLVVLAGLFSSSVWNPVTTQDLKTYVESFDHARFSSASWREWQVPAEWLHDSKMQLDLSKPRALLKKELVLAEPNPYILCPAIKADLIHPQDLDQIPDLAVRKNLKFSEYQRGEPFYSVNVHIRFLIQALVMRGELSESERDYLGERLAATMEGLKTKTIVPILEEQLAITQLAQFIDRPLDLELYRDFVHQTLVSHQVLIYKFGHPRGGFTQYTKLNHSDHRATVDAIELMQIYGVPEGVQIDALRSYLRPKHLDLWSRMHARACVRVASLQRLESLPEVQPITWMDYFRYEQNLMMAILFTLVCVFATLGAPKLNGPTSK